MTGRAVSDITHLGAVASAGSAEPPPPRRNWASPTEALVAAFRLPGGRQLAVLCPYCRQLHFHGAAGFGGRVSHCFENARNYYLVDAGPAASGAAVARKFGTRRP